MRHQIAFQVGAVKEWIGVFIWMFCLVAYSAMPMPLSAQGQKIIWTEQEKPIVEKIRGLRALPDDVRAGVTRQLALDIRKLPPGQNKVRLALSLAGLSTEGDFGHDTLQDVTTTLASALSETPQAEEKGQPAEPYMEVAQLVHYEHMQATVEDPQFAAAIKKLDEADKQRQDADFSLPDLQGKLWTLNELRGKVVLVNFWATWCPPCRKEMPDLQKLYNRFQKKGLVILAISMDEEPAKVPPFVAQQKFTYPILLDTGEKVSKTFLVWGIPKTFVFDRDGKLVAQSIDMRTERQFLGMLGAAGLR
jgi:peroxiredoxin